MRLDLAVLWGTAAYHLVMGAFSLLSPRLTMGSFGRLYRVEYPDGVSPALEFLWKPFGAFAWVVSAFCIRAAVEDDESARQFTLLVVSGLFTLRAVIRIGYRALLYRAHHVPPRRNWTNVGFSLTLAALAAWCAR